MSMIEIADTDFKVYDHGSVIGIDAKSDAGKAWLAENVAAEGWQFLGRVLWVEHGVADAVLAGIEDDDLTLEAC